MKKTIVMVLTLLLLLSCSSSRFNSQVIPIEDLEKLTHRLIYSEEEFQREQALTEATGRGVSVRFYVVKELLTVIQSRPERFPKYRFGDEPSLFKEIIKPGYLEDIGTENEKEFLFVRTEHMKILNSMMLFCAKWRLNYEMAEIQYQKYLCGTRWSQESLSLYNNRLAATEFRNARNAGAVYLQLLADITRDEKTDAFIESALQNVDKELKE